MLSFCLLSVLSYYGLIEFPMLAISNNIDPRHTRSYVCTGRYYIIVGELEL